MRRTRREKPPESAINITPLLDVVFILLIFFLVTASFIKESGIDLTRSGALSAESSGSQHSILVLIGSNDELWVNRRPVTLGALQPVVKQLHAEDPSARLIVAADPNSSNGMLVRVIDASRLAGVPDVSVAQVE